MRLRGGTKGILSAIDAGRLDPLSAWMPEEMPLGALRGADARRAALRNRRREKAMAKRDGD